MTTLERKAPLPRLSLMMFLQYAVWGLWLPTLGRYLQASVSDGGLGFTPGQVGYIIGLAGSIGAISAPFIAGQLADRYFQAQRFLAFLLLAGGITQIILAHQTTYYSFLFVAIIYSILFMPTLSLTNSLAFSHMADSEKEFPKVRVWGTIGWIVASWVFPMIWLQVNLKFTKFPPFFAGAERVDSTHRLIDAMTASGGLSILYAIYSVIVLPSTPPKRDNVETLAFKKAFALLKKPSVAIVVISSLFISIIHQIYFIETSSYFAFKGLRNSLIAPAMTVSQFAEFFVMLLLGVMLAKMRFRWVIALGAFCYFLRYVIWATPSMPMWAVVSSQVLAGFCYACFFAGTFIYIDRVAPADVRHSAQTGIGIVILGLGPICSAFVLPAIIKATHKAGSAADSVNYFGMWAVLAAVGLLVALFVALFFREEASAPQEAKLAPEEPELA